MNTMTENPAENPSYYGKNNNKWACFDYASGFIDTVFSSYISEYSRLTQGAVDVAVMSRTSELTIAMFSYIKYKWRKDDKHPTPDEDIKKAATYLDKINEISPTFGNFFVAMYDAYDNDPNGTAYDEIKLLKEQHMAQIEEQYSFKPKPKIHYGGQYQSSSSNKGSGYVSGSTFLDIDEEFADGTSDDD